MAIYEYRCPSCKVDFELSRPMQEATAPAACPRCGAAAERLISGFASRFGYGIQGVTKPPFRTPAGESSQDAEA